MTEEAEVQLSPEQQYLADLINKFNANPEDDTITAEQRVLIGQLTQVTKTISSMVVRSNELASEIQTNQNSLSEIQQNLLFKRGQSQGLVDALFALQDKSA